MTGSEIYSKVKIQEHSRKGREKWHKMIAFYHSIFATAENREESGAFNALDMTRNTKYIAFALQETTIQIYVIVSNIEHVVCSVVIFNGNVIVNMAR